MKRQYIFLMSAIATMMTLTSCDTLLAIDSTPAGTVYTSGGTIYTSGGTIYNTGYGSGYDGRYAYSGMRYEEARREALFLSDKMAYELGLTDAQYEAIYEINLDYLLNMRDERSIYGDYWARRNSDIFYVLSASQYNYFVNMDYFYRPVYWYDNRYVFSIYSRYDNPRYYYRSRPVYYDTYRGGRNLLSNSYYEGRFGRRTGQPVVINRNSGSFGGYNNNDSRIIQTPQNGNNGSQPSFGNQRRDNERPSRGSFGNSSMEGRPFGVQPQRKPQRSDFGNSSFGGSRQGTTLESSGFGRNDSRSNSSDRTNTFGSDSRRPTTPSNSGFNNSSESRNSFGNSTPRSNPQPRPTIERPAQNNGSFGGHR